ncbi:MAG: CsbD family protein [Planctomycetaceae bacterium]|nr:CsbD family protein [Planctomycetaceae bacterium]
MISQQELRGHWNIIKGAMKEKWGKLTDDDLAAVQGSFDRLVGIVQKRTGESKESIEAFVEATIDDGASMLHSAAERLRSNAACLNEAANEQYDAAQAAVMDGLTSAKETIKRRPGESIAVCFGAGLIAGAVLGLTLGNRRS